jgi:hypothetical protein
MSRVCWSSSSSSSSSSMNFVTLKASKAAQVTSSTTPQFLRGALSSKMKLSNLLIPLHHFAITAKIWLPVKKTVPVTVTAIKVALPSFGLTSIRQGGRTRNTAAVPARRSTAPRCHRCRLQSHRARNFKAVGPDQKLNLPRALYF